MIKNGLFGSVPKSPTQISSPSVKKNGGKEFSCLGTFKAILKGHGNEADFLGFLQKSVPHEPITLLFELF
jgi:hypothetical protein